jgi:hypothetical protein
MRLSRATALLVLSCTGAIAAACGGDEADSTPVVKTGRGGSAGSGATGGTAGASTTGGAAGASTGGSAGGGGTGIQFGGSAGQPTDAGAGGAVVAKKITINPPSAIVTVKQLAAPVSTKLTAVLEGTTTEITPIWTLSSYATGTIAPDGTFTASGKLGGKVVVTATYGGESATATLDVQLALYSPPTNDTDPANQTALAGQPQPEPVSPSAILYPYEGTVFPRGLLAPLLQFSPGGTPPEDAKISLTSNQFSWSRIMHVAAGTTPQLTIPQDIWDAALASSGGESVRISVVKAAGGQAYGPVESTFVVAPAALTGAVYYMTYSGEDTANPANSRNGLYSVLPGKKDPAKLVLQGCVVCHSVSSNGTRLSTGADAATELARSGVYGVGADGNLVGANGPVTPRGGEPPLMPTPPELGSVTEPARGGADSRGISHAAWTPDGKYVFRDLGYFTGGTHAAVWRADEVQKALLPGTVTGLEGFSALIPAFSHDGKRFVFTAGDGTGPVAGVAPSARRSLVVMDVAIDETTNTLAFTNPKVVLDNGATGDVVKFAAFLPDSNYLVVQEGHGYQEGNGFEYMLPTWDAASTYQSSTGHLILVKIDTGERIELPNLNKGLAEIDAERNYEPFVLPVPAGGYFWVVLTSIRSYGNTYAWDADPAKSQVRKQIWAGAIDTTTSPGKDPSHRPFYLPGQTDTPNERGFWALSPCQSDGASCSSGDQCCGGFCRPSDLSDPSSPTVCKPPEVGQCAQTSEKCSTDGDCCGATANVRCIGGVCTIPTPPVPPPPPVPK